MMTIYHFKYANYILQNHKLNSFEYDFLTSVIEYNYDNVVLSLTEKQEVVYLRIVKKYPVEIVMHGSIADKIFKMMEGVYLSEIEINFIKTYSDIYIYNENIRKIIEIFKEKKRRRC